MVPLQLISTRPQAQPQPRRLVNVVKVFPHVQLDRRHCDMAHMSPVLGMLPAMMADMVMTIAAAGYPSSEGPVTRLPTTVRPALEIN